MTVGAERVNKANIVICDDERAESDYIAALVREWADGGSLSAHISFFDSAESFLFNHEDGRGVDILLLDIQMKKMDGVELARRIRENNEITQIIFITGYPDFIAEGYEVSAVHFLTKPVDEQKLFAALDRAVSRLRKAPRFIVFPKTGGDIRIGADDILYAEVLSHTVSLYLINGKEEFNMRISDMEALLGEGFLKCHRSYIVSMKRVRRVTKTAVVLTDGKDIPLSRNLYDAACQAFISHN
jgi:DNA-binding LytR/AlgR family response regulator